MIQEWKNLFFIHYKVPPSHIEPHIPSGTKLDLYEGFAVLGVVGLQIGGISFLWLPHLRYGFFNELNLRTYIQTREGEKLVYFFSLDCHSLIASILAKTFYKLPYYYSHIQYKIEKSNVEMRCLARQKYPCQYRIKYDGELFHAPTLPHAEFFVERYAFITTDKNLRHYRGDLEHAPYQLYHARTEVLKDKLPQADGLKLGSLNQISEGCFFSPGMSVRVIDFRRLN